MILIRETTPEAIRRLTVAAGVSTPSTLYAALNVLNDGDRSILTIEDPVEQRIAGIKQMQIAPKAGVTFDAGLRSMLRADPDVIMVGEIRDRETAHIAVEAALTGHMVLSTLHTRDAPSASASSTPATRPTARCSSPGPPGRGSRPLSTRP